MDLSSFIQAKIIARRSHKVQGRSWSFIEQMVRTQLVSNHLAIDKTNEIPADGGLSDEELIKIGLNDWTIIKERWSRAPYVWSKKGILYKSDNRLFLHKNKNKPCSWPDHIQKRYCFNHKPVEHKARLEGFQTLYNSRGNIRNRAPKQIKQPRFSQIRCLRWWTQHSEYLWVLGFSSVVGIQDLMRVRMNFYKTCGLMLFKRRRQLNHASLSYG